MVTRTENVFVRRRRVELQLVARIPCMHPTAAVVIITQSPPSQHSSPRETAADNVSWIRCRDVAPEIIGMDIESRTC